MSNHFDYYREAKEIATLLAKSGDKKTSELVLEKIEAGSTATEILMGVRWAIEGRLKERGILLGDLEKRMLSLVARIDGALK